MQLSNVRSRKFSLITYLPEEYFLIRLQGHNEQVRVWAYAKHDKDLKEDGTLKEPHTHLILITYNAHSISSIRRWFSGFHDENGEITTTAQICRDEFNAFDYLTHNTKQALAEGKPLYDKSIVKSNNFDYFKANSEHDYDSTLLACELLLKGVSVHDCAKMFGRDFILHYGQIKNYLMDVLQMRDDDRITDFDSLIKRQTFNILEGQDKNAR